VDKVLPQLAHLAPEFISACPQSIFVQADASRPASMSRIFDRPDTTAPWDYVFNLGGETALSQTPELYRLRSYTLSTTLAAEAAKRNCGVFIEASTGMVYSPTRTPPRKEGDKLKPWLKLAKAKLEAEEALSRIPGLNLVVLRLAHVYGEYDSGFVAKALCLARVYQEQEREMKWLWTEDLRINTVWVEDVARALWRAAEWRSQNRGVVEGGGVSSSRRPSLIGGAGGGKGDDGPVAGTAVFNIVDRGSTSQGTLASIISQVFGIKTGFQGSLISQFAKLNLEHVVDDLNEDILQPWADMLAKKGITRPGPLSPFLEKELLKDTDLSLDGGLFERACDFKYEREKGLDVQGVKEMVASYEKMGWWP
jgi:nucleoside-diphosphate-sugar epimerase